MFLDILNFWQPLYNLNFELVFFQFYIVYVIYLVYSSNNIYYTLLYTCFLFFLFGIYLSFWQIEIFTGFLWLLELTILFVYLLVLFYLNFKGYTNSHHTKEYFFGKYFYLTFYLLVNFFFFGCEEGYLPEELNFFCIWENYYETLCNHNMNDFSLFLLSYYHFNSLEFFILGMILLIGSIVCVNLYKSTKESTPHNAVSMLKNFDFYKDSWNYNFLRKQNLTNQNLTLPSTRVISKKM